MWSRVRLATLRYMRHSVATPDSTVESSEAMLRELTTNQVRLGKLCAFYLCIALHSAPRSASCITCILFMHCIKCMIPACITYFWCLRMLYHGVREWFFVIVTHRKCAELLKSTCELFNRLIRRGIIMLILLINWNAWLCTATMSQPLNVLWLWENCTDTLNTWLMMLFFFSQEWDSEVPKPSMLGTLY